MSVPIPALPEATSLANDDLMLVRQGLLDKKVRVSLIRQVAFSTISILPGTALENDLMLIDRAGVNYKARFAAIGLMAGTVAWFYQDTAPRGWNPLDDTSGALLAIKGATATEGYNGAAGNLQGTWQQEDHTLTIAQIPSHNHGVKGTNGNLNQGNQVSANGRGNNDWFTENEGGGQGHNHGDTWRPLARVGILCKKSE